MHRDIEETAAGYQNKARKIIQEEHLGHQFKNPL
jgi:hypothetical protein